MFERLAEAYRQTNNAAAAFLNRLTVRLEAKTAELRERTEALIEQAEDRIIMGREASA